MKRYRLKRFWRPKNGKLPLHVLADESVEFFASWVSFISEDGERRYFLRSHNRWTYVASFQIDADEFWSRWV